MTHELWLVVLSSSVVSGIVGTLIGGWFNLRSKRNDYANTYYKLVLDRRLAAYEEVEQLIIRIKVAVLDKDQRPYHLLFSDDNDQESVYKLLFSVMSRALWFSDELFERTRDLNVLIFSRTKDSAGLVEFGKSHYREIAELRTAIEKLHARDMLTLHEVPKFLRSKKPTDGYAQLPTVG